MTDEQKIETIATKVMGWEERDTPMGVAWATGQGSSYIFFCYCRDYNPLTDANQAFEALEKWCDRHPQTRESAMWYSDEAHCVRLYDDYCPSKRVRETTTRNKSLARAICLALVRAIKMERDND